MSEFENKMAPDFTLPDQSEKEHSLSDYFGQYVLLYFYPKDMTPGCTVEACTFRDTLNDFKKEGIQVLGVSADSVDRHKKFAEKYDLNFPLLSDMNKKVVQEYGVYQEKSFMGKIGLGINRESFLISPEGKILKHYQKVKPADHPAEVLKDTMTIRKAKLNA